MSGQRVVVGIGEALLHESAGGVRAGGLAAEVALAAIQAGQRGVIVSRLGQDAAAEQVLRHLRSASVNLDALQSDPDLATGRLVERTFAGRLTRSLTNRAAFDNLQWDFDLVDIAQQADAVVFGQLARRDGQGQSIIKRFLAECTGAIRVFDLTNRAGEIIDRIDARSGAEFAEGLVVDAVGLRALAGSWNGEDHHLAARDLLRSSSALGFVACITDAAGGRSMTVHTPEHTASSPKSYPASRHTAAVVGLICGMLEGNDLARCASNAAALASQTDEL